ncbi:FAD dependent oxidoreductase, partial [Coniella lustricola]
HILVVGGGIVGASIAWHLTRHSTSPKVTIVAENVGGTATPCSFAWLNASWHNPKHYFDFRHRSMAAWRQMAETLPELAKEVRWDGSLCWDKSPQELDQYIQQHTAWGYDIHRAKCAEMAVLEPALDPSIFPDWAVRVGEEGAVEADAGARALVADAQKHGARLVTASVEALLQTGANADTDTGAALASASVNGIITSTGETVYADHVILAAGIGSIALGATAGVTVPLKDPAPPGLLVHTKPIPRRILHHIVYNTQGHMRQTAVEGRILAGADFVGGDPGADPSATARAHLETVKASFQPAERELLEFDYYTIGYRPQPLDGMPVIGDTGVEGLSLAVMHSGVTNAALVGELLASKVLTGKEDEALKAFALSRF